MDSERIVKAYATLRERFDHIADENPGREPTIKAVVDFLLSVNDECEGAAMILCPGDDPLHFHHDGCQACSMEDHILAANVLESPIDGGCDEPF